MYFAAKKNASQDHQGPGASFNNLEEALFFACFFSDKYFQSKKCVSELHRALQSGKRILVFLVPGPGAVSQSGM